MKNESLATLRYSNQSIRIMAAMLHESGIDPTPVFRHAGLDLAIAENPEGEISGVEELRFQEAFAAATRSIPGLWFKTGLRYRLMSYGPLGLAALAAANLADSLRVLSTFQALTYSLINYRLEECGGEPVALMADDSLAPRDLREFLQERALAAATMFLNDMRQQPFPLERIESVLVRPEHWLDWDRLLGVPIVFGSPATRWIFTPGTGPEPLPMASPLLEETYQHLCSRLVGEARTTDPLVSRIYGTMVRSGRGFPSASALAEQLGVSERSLHRHLSARATSYGVILDAVREQRGRYLLERSMLSVERIADMLGFAETASFSRAFKRWTGVSPLAFRKQRT